MKAMYPVSVTLLSMVDFADFMTSSLNLVEDNKIKTKVSSLNLHFTYLKDTLPRYREAIKQVRTSTDTEKISQLDKNRDHDIQALFNSIKPFKNSRRSADKEAYTQLALIFDNYKKLRLEPYSKQSVLVTKLLEDLDKSPANAAVETLAIGKFLGDLKASQAAFTKAFDSRQVTNSLEQEVSARELRKEMTTRYKLLCNATQNLEYLNRKGELSTPEAADILRCLNTARKDMAEQVKRSQTSSKKAKSKKASK